MSPPLRLPTPQLEYVPFQGGYDTESRSWNVKPGKVRETQNYEITINDQGYVDIQGYEIFDGQVSPSDQTYAILDVVIYIIIVPFILIFSLGGFIRIIGEEYGWRRVDHL